MLVAVPRPSDGPRPLPRPASNRRAGVAVAALGCLGIPRFGGVRGCWEQVPLPLPVWCCACSSRVFGVAAAVALPLPGSGPLLVPLPPRDGDEMPPPSLGAEPSHAAV